MLVEQHPRAEEIFAYCYRDRASEESVATKLSDGWDTQVLVIGDFVIGAVTRKNGEFHFGVVPGFRGKWATRSNMKKILEWAAESGPVTTTALHGSLGERLAKFIGMRDIIANDKGARYVYP